MGGTVVRGGGDAAGWREKNENATWPFRVAVLAIVSDVSRMYRTPECA